MRNGRYGDTEETHKKDGHVIMETQTIGMELEAKEWQGFLANTRNWKRGTEQSLPLDLQKEPTLLTFKFHRLLAS